MKNKNSYFLLIAVLFLGLSLFVPVTHAQVLNYQLLEKIPGSNNLSGTDLKVYIESIYNVALILVTLAAVLMLSIGGFWYLTSAGNTSRMGTAKEIIVDSLIGLVIALTAWLILNVINPDLVKTTLTSLPMVPITAQSGAPGGIGNPPTADAAGYAAQILANGNISVNASGDCKSQTGVVSPKKNLEDTKAGVQAAACYAGKSCPSQGDRGCVDNAVRLSETMLKALATVGGSYKFTIVSLSGGPHAANSAHYVGTAVDIIPRNAGEWQAILDALVANGAASPAGNARSMCENPKGQNVGCAPGSGANHIHVIF